ncbi:group 1 truncated hemoglobin [soil metagenome]
MRRLLSMSFRHIFLVCAACIALAACSSAPPSPPKTSLYERLGGLPAITAVIDKTIDKASTDPRTSRSFKDVKLKNLKESLTLHLCHIAGGPCKYDGPNMAKAHSGLAITSAEFDAMAGMVAETLDQFKVPAAEKNELMGVLAAMKPEVVGK